MRPIGNGDLSKAHSVSIRVRVKRVVVASVVSVLGAIANQTHAQDNVVTITAWADYIPDDVIEGFEDRTGIKVVYNYFDTLASLETKMLIGDSGYDVIFPSALVANRLIQAGALQKLNKNRLPNIGNLDAEIMSFLAQHDDGNQYGVPYLWGTTGVIYNPALIFDRMKDAPISSLDILFDPDLVSKFADCGIAFIDSPEEVVAIALNYLGLDPFTKDSRDFEKVEALLKPIQPYIRHFNTGSIINELARGDLCLVLGWSGDAGLAYANALEADNGLEISFVIPDEGTEVFFDFLSIPVDAPNPSGAHAFVDYLMEPEVIASVTNLYYYPNGNKASLEYVLDEIKSDPSVYPTQEMMARLFPNLPRDQKTLRVLTRAWTRFKTGRLP